MYARKLGICSTHGEVEFVQRGDTGSWRCVPCRAAAVTERRRRVKAILIEEAGGACAACGYDACAAALQFHHRDPAAKQFALSAKGVARSLARARAEASKCVLLCANCHAEVEAGVRTIPA
jgi:hypothetical protein